MVLTQTDINNLNSQYKNLKTSSKSIFVAAVLAAKCTGGFRLLQL